jgi:hypothetical protein
MWTAYFQVDGEQRYEVSTRKFRHTVELELEKFLKRITHPEVGVWWVWVEETDAPYFPAEEQDVI